MLHVPEINYTTWNKISRLPWTYSISTDFYDFSVFNLFLVKFVRLRKWITVDFCMKWDLHKGWQDSIIEIVCESQINHKHTNDIVFNKFMSIFEIESKTS